MSLEGTAKTEYASLSGKIHTIVIDKTLSVSGACADAKATGDAIEKVVENAEQAAKTIAENVMSEGVKTKDAYSLVAGGADKKLTDVGNPLVDPSVLFGHTNGLPDWKSLDELTDAMGAARIATGSYVGTGTWGASNPTSLTFNFVPKIVFIHSGMQMTMIPADGYAFSHGVGGNQGYTETGVNTTLSGTTLSWFCPPGTGDPGAQMNTSEQTYHYVAIG